MNLEQMKDKIINDRELVLNPDLRGRDFSFTEVKGFATVLVGARRVGKTSYMKHFAKTLIENGLEPEKICYLSFFTADDLDFPFSLIHEAYYSLYPHLRKAGDVYFILDEIQGIPNWGGGVAYLMENYPAHVVITGSSARYLSTDIASELRGRSLSWSFYPLSFGEFLAFNKEHVPEGDSYSDGEKARLSFWFDRYMERGSYPALCESENEEVRKLILNSYFDLAFSRDLVDRFDIGRSSMLRALLRRLIKNSGSPYTIRKLVNVLKSAGFSTSIMLVSEYIRMILDTCFFIEVPIYGTEKQQDRNERKLYVIDHQMAVLFREFGKNRGVVLEHIVLMHLRRNSKLNIAYYRSKDDWECDFILYDEDKTPCSLIQVTDDWEDSREREIRGLRAAMKETGLKNGSIITYQDIEELEFPEGKIHVLPAWRFVLGKV